jgi:PE-PPE domain
MRWSRVLPATALAGAAASAMVAVGFISAPRANADTRITMPGAGPLYEPDIITQDIPGLGQRYFLGDGQQGVGSLTILQGYDLLNHEIGENWFPDSTAQVVNYPASIGILSGSLAAPGADEAIAAGQQALNDQIMNAVANGNGEPVMVAGLSMGTIVIDHELAYLATDPTAPSPSDLLFASFSNPQLGFADTYLPAGTFVPVADYTMQDMPDTQYNVDVVFHQYDAWANPPDRPWDLLSVVNALVGTSLYHNAAALAAPSDAELISTVHDSLGGTIDTYMIPSSTLPLLVPLQWLGVPENIVDGLNSVLKPIVDEGYSALTPDAGPFLWHGELLGLQSFSDMAQSLQSGISDAAGFLDSGVAQLDLPADITQSLGSGIVDIANSLGSEIAQLFSAL